MKASASGNSPPVISIAFVSATALAYEILLMRLFSIIQWHHYAYMVISLALLGYGISGTLLAMTQRWMLARFARIFPVNVYLFGLTAVACFLLVQAIPFNPEEMLWDYHELSWLVLAYLVLSLPFLFAANAVALAMAHYRQAINRIYAFDLFGAGLGSLAILLLLFRLPPLNALFILGALAMLVAVLASWELQRGTISFPAWCQHRSTLLLATCTGLAIVSGFVIHPSLQLSPYKSLSQTLRISGTRVIDQYTSPLGLLTIVESPMVPFRYVPGLSLNASQEPPPQLGVFTDGDSMSVITQMPASLNGLAYLDRLTTALPYQLAQPKRVLVLDGGTGTDVLQALLHRVAAIDVVELNPQLVRLLRRDYADYAGRIYSRQNVSVQIADARGFVSGAGKSYDLIQLALLDSFGPAGSGLYTLHENYLYTVEAIAAYMRHLNNNAYLALTQWVSLPPRGSLKLFNTVLTTLHEQGVAQPAQRLIMIRSWQTATLLVKNGRIGQAEIAALQQFCARNSFDLVYYPGIRAGQANRYNKLQHADFYLGTQALLDGRRQAFLQQYKFNLQAATDDRPYPFNFFKWSTLPEILSLRGKGGLPLLEAGYLVMIIVLLQAVLASLLLILLPQWVLWRRQDAAGGCVARSRVIGYFFALGLAFLLIEIAFIQKFSLFLHHPLYAAGVVLGGFLIFAGLGSAWSRRHHSRLSARQLTAYAISGIAGLSLIYLVCLGSLFDALNMLSLWAKIPLAVMLIAPLAFCMGMPFPAGLTRLGELEPQLIPWAWGINGCASVVSAVLASLIAIHAGFSTVIVVAMGLYLLALVFFPATRDIPQ